MLDSLFTGWTMNIEYSQGDNNKFKNNMKPNEYYEEDKLKQKELDRNMGFFTKEDMEKAFMAGRFFSLKTDEGAAFPDFIEWYKKYTA